MTQKIRPIRIEGNVAHVPLTMGCEAIIDAVDVPLVSGYSWTAMICLRKDGGVKKIYACRNMPRSSPVRGKVFMHRCIVEAKHEVEVDHIDGDGLNNRRVNLRMATARQNAQNRKTPTNNTSGHKGVYWSKKSGKWVARIKRDGRLSVLGYFTEKDDAAVAYAKAAGELFGEFARSA